MSVLTNPKRSESKKNRELRLKKYLENRAVEVTIVDDIADLKPAPERILWYYNAILNNTNEHSIVTIAHIGVAISRTKIFQ